MAKRKPAKKATPKSKKKPAKKSRAKAKAKPKTKKKAAKPKTAAKARTRKKIASPPPLKAVKKALIPVILERDAAPLPDEKPRRRRRRKLKTAEMAEIRKLLLKRREELLAEITEEIRQSKIGAKPRSADPTDQASDSADGDLALALAQSGSDELQQVEAALARIGSGEFGSCEECGRGIPIARLRALPYATTCIDCKRLRELGSRADNLEDAWEALHDSEQETAEQED